MNVDTLVHFANDSGGVLYMIAAMLFVALTIIVERLWYFRRVAQCGRTALDKLDHLDHLDTAALSGLAGQYRDLPVARLFTAAVRLQFIRHREDLDARLEEVVMREAPQIDRFLWVLDTIVTLAPLLGLFGTIVGMFNAFQVLSNPGNAPVQVTGGVAQALVATASGLFVAMVGLVFFNSLHNRVRGIVHQLDTLKVALVNRLVSMHDDAPQEAARATREASRAPAGKLVSQGA